jgi:vancomycin resistance protein YoaR
VAGFEIGGLSASEARERLSQALNWPARTLTLAGDEGEFTFTYAELGLVPDLDRTLAQARLVAWWKTAPQQLELVVTLDQQTFALTAAHLAELVNRPAASAALVFGDDGRVTVSPHVLGASLDVPALQQLVLAGGRWERLPTRVPLPVRSLMPEVTTADLTALGIVRRVAQFSTRFREHEPRADNVRLAAAAIDGILLRPGEVFSFNQVVGPRTAERGYQLANVYYGNRVIQGIGGGVCQVSTTLYNAVLLADLELVRRHNHSMPVDYVPLGQDAAVAFDEDLDLQFRNDTGAHLLIKASAVDGVLTFSLFGDAPEDLRVEVKTQVVATFPYPTETREDPRLPQGEEQVTEGREGMRVLAEARVHANGSERVRPLPASYYVPVPKVIRIGTGPAE